MYAVNKCFMNERFKRVQNKKSDVWIKVEQIRLLCPNKCSSFFVICIYYIPSSFLCNLVN